MASDQDSNPSQTIYTILAYGDSYVQPLLTTAVHTLSQSGVKVKTVPSIESLHDPKVPCLCWQQYEALPFSDLSSRPESLLVNAYVFRKALIRKHYLATTVRNWLVKYPDSVLSAHVKPSVDFEVDYAEFLDDALVECFELNESMARNENLEAVEREWWILKAGMAERGGGIRLFSTLDELSAIFEAWDPDDSGDEAVDDDDDMKRQATRDGGDNGIVTSQMRHFVAQAYVDRPLLLKAPFASGGRKFHIRTYVVAVGALKIFVYRRMLALFAGPEYHQPGQQGDPNHALNAHLTNTCLQSGEREGSVHDFWSIPGETADLVEGWKDSAFNQICEVTGETFQGAAKGMSIHFQPLPNAFEIFGLDFLVDASGCTWLLEVNAFPDFAQTGPDLRPIIDGLLLGTVEAGVKPFFGIPSDPSAHDMIQVLDIDLGRR